MANYVDLIIPREPDNIRCFFDQLRGYWYNDMHAHVAVRLPYAIRYRGSVYFPRTENLYFNRFGPSGFQPRTTVSWNKRYGNDPALFDPITRLARPHDSGDKYRHWVLFEALYVFDPNIDVTFDLHRQGEDPHPRFQQIAPPHAMNRIFAPSAPRRPLAVDRRVLITAPFYVISRFLALFGYRGYVIGSTITRDVWEVTADGKTFFASGEGWALSGQSDERAQFDGFESAMLYMAIPPRLYDAICQWTDVMQVQQLERDVSPFEPAPKICSPLPPKSVDASTAFSRLTALHSAQSIDPTDIPLAVQQAATGTEDSASFYKTMNQLFRRRRMLLQVMWLVPLGLAIIAMFGLAAVVASFLIAMHFILRPAIRRTMATLVYQQKPGPLNVYFHRFKPFRCLP